MKERLEEIYHLLANHYGPTHWWPGDSPFEVAVGAILTQNTAWANVVRAIENLKKMHLLTPSRMHAVPVTELEAAIRSSGYYHQKAERLRLFCGFLLKRYNGRMSRMAARPLTALRAELLELKGIGQETADDILLYACDKPIFVVDAYTVRIFHRCGLTPEHMGYDALQQLVHTHFAPDVHHYKELHGLIVWTGKDFCRKQPRCLGCPLALSQAQASCFPCCKPVKTAPIVR